MTRRRRRRAADVSDAARGGGPPNEIASLLALHDAAVALAVPVPPEPEAVETLLATIVRAARAALGAAHARLVLAECPTWRVLLPAVREVEPDAADGPFQANPTVSLHVLGDGQVETLRQRLRSRGPIVHALETGEGVLIPDILADSVYGPHPKRERAGLRSSAVVPLRVTGEVLGALSVSFLKPGFPHADLEQALDLFAAHAAAAVERVRALYDERRRTHQAERMAATLASIGASATLEEGLEALVRGGMDLLGGVCGTARVRDPASGERPISVSVERDGTVTVHRPAGAPRLGSYAAAIEAGGPAVLVDDFWALNEREYPYHQEMRQAGLRASVMVPMDAGEKRIGSLHFDHPTPSYFTRLDVSLAETLAAYAAQAVLRLRLEEERGERARLDGAMLVARTVAHEINNALSPVVGYAELLGLRPAVAADPKAADFVRQIGEAAADATAKVLRLQRIVRLQEDVSPLGPSHPSWTWTAPRGASPRIVEETLSSSVGCVAGAPVLHLRLRHHLRAALHVSHVRLLADLGPDAVRPAAPGV